MAVLLLESDTDVIDLDGQAGVGYGFQSHSGALGLGMPSADVRWFEGAGHGAVYRGRRVRSRSIEIPVSCITRGSDQTLQQYLDRLAVMLSRPCRLVRVDDEGERWWCEVAHVGGADYVTGTDTNGETEWYGTLQFTAGDPTWRRWRPDIVTVSPEPAAGEVGYGVVPLYNTGSADTYPQLEVQGPGKNLVIRNEEGLGITYTADIPSDATLLIDMELGQVRERGSTGPFALYRNLADGPTLIPLKPGLNKWTITMDNRATGTTSTIAKASTEPRRINEYRYQDTPVKAARIIRKNLCKNPQGTAATTVTGGQYEPIGWSVEGAGGFVVRRTVNAPTGPIPNVTNAAKFRWDRITFGKVARALAPVVDVDPSKTYTFSAYVLGSNHRDTEWAPVTVQYGLGMERVATRRSDYVFLPKITTPSKDNWVRVSWTLQPDPGVRYIEFGVQCENVHARIDELHMTGVLVEQTDKVFDFFDGRTADKWGINFGWTGTVDLSTSEAEIQSLQSVWDGYGLTYFWEGPMPYSHPHLTTCTYATTLWGGQEFWGAEIPHNLGDSWVASMKAKYVGSLRQSAQVTSGEVSLSMKQSLNDEPTGPAIVRSPVVYPASTGITVAASGSGTPPPASTTGVRPVVTLYEEGVIVALYDFLIERSTALGSYFDGWGEDSINGIFEPDTGTGGTRGFEFEAKEVQQSLTTIYQAPRRWMIL